MQPKFLAIIFAITIFISVIELIRRQKIDFRYSFSWLSACILVLVLAINHPLLFKIAHFFGFELPSNFIFFLLLIFVIFLTLLLTIFINEQNNRTQKLSQSLGILQYKMEKLEKESGSSGKEKTL